jgi:hypothetical protein
MKSDTPKYENIDLCVRRAIQDIGGGMERYEQFLLWAIEGLNDLNFDMMRESKTKKLEVTSKMTVEFPKDYISWVRIGVVHKGWVVNLTRDEGIANKICCGDDSEEYIMPRDSNFGWNEYGTRINSHGEYTGREFGVGKKPNDLGFFRENRRLRHFALNTHRFVKGDKIYIEYVASMSCAGPNTVVNGYLAKLIKLYVHWQRKENSDKYTDRQAARSEDLYWREHGRAADRLMDWDINELLQATADNTNTLKYS